MPDCDCDCNERINKIIDRSLFTLLCVFVLALLCSGAYTIGYEVGYDKAFYHYLKGK